MEQPSRSIYSSILSVSLYLKVKRSEVKLFFMLVLVTYVCFFNLLFILNYLELYIILLPLFIYFFYLQLGKALVPVILFLLFLVTH